LTSLRRFGGRKGGMENEPWHAQPPANKQTDLLLCPPRLPSNMNSRPGRRRRHVGQHHAEPHHRRAPPRAVAPEPVPPVVVKPAAAVVAVKAAAARREVAAAAAAAAAARPPVVRAAAAGIVVIPAPAAAAAVVVPRLVRARPAAAAPLRPLAAVEAAAVVGAVVVVAAAALERRAVKPAAPAAAAAAARLVVTAAATAAAAAAALLQMVPLAGAAQLLAGHRLDHAHRRAVDRDAVHLRWRREIVQGGRVLAPSAARFLLGVARACTPSLPARPVAADQQRSTHLCDRSIHPGKVFEVHVAKPARPSGLFVIHHLRPGGCVTAGWSVKATDPVRRGAFRRRSSVPRPQSRLRFQRRERVTLTDSTRPQCSNIFPSWSSLTIALLLTHTLQLRSIIALGAGPRRTAAAVRLLEGGDREQSGRWYLCVDARSHQHSIRDKQGCRQVTVRTLPLRCSTEANAAAPTPLLRTYAAGLPGGPSALCKRTR
jgi:hypothetical protein